MNVIIETREENVTPSFLTVYMDNKIVFHVWDGDDESSPEENTLENNFWGCHNIDVVIRKAYSAGKSGELLSMQWRYKQAEETD